MSNVNLKMLAAVVTERHADRPAFLLWQLRPSEPPECCRWACADGRWVSLTLCHEADMGRVLVRHADGRAQHVDSYEDALRLAREWRNE